MDMNWYQQQAITREHRQDALRSAAQRQWVRQAQLARGPQLPLFARLMNLFSQRHRLPRQSSRRTSPLNWVKE